MPSAAIHVKKLKTILELARAEAEIQEQLDHAARVGKPFVGYRMVAIYDRLASFGTFMKRYEGQWSIEVLARDEKEAQKVAQSYIENRYAVWGSFRFTNVERTDAKDVSDAKEPGVVSCQGTSR